MLFSSMGFLLLRIVLFTGFLRWPTRFTTSKKITFVRIFDVMVISILSVNIFLLGLIITFLQVKKAGNPVSRWLLTSIFAIFLLSLLEGLYLFTGVYPTFPQAAFWATPFVLLLGPGLYFFTKSVLYRSFHFHKADLFHLLPFLVVLVTMQWTYQRLPFQEQVAVISESLHTGNPPTYILTGTLVFFGIVAGYIFLAFRQIGDYTRRLKMQYADFEHKDPDWLRSVLLSFLVILLLSFIQNVIRLFSPDLWRVSIIVNLALFIYIGSKLLFRFMDHRALSLPDYGPASPADKEQLIKIANEAHQLMRQEKTYLNDSISLQMVADKLGVRAAQLSQALNVGARQNFFDFINQYRIKEAARKLRAFTPQEQNITEIMYSCGFNSKSSFNTAFKKYMGTTPSAYRKTAPSPD